MAQLSRSGPASRNGCVASVHVSDELIAAHLDDGRIISIPVALSWRLSDATPEQRSQYEITGQGSGVHWPDVDEDLSLRSMLSGVPARRPVRH